MICFPLYVIMYVYLLMLMTAQCINTLQACRIRQPYFKTFRGHVQGGYNILISLKLIFSSLSWLSTYFELGVLNFSNYHTPLVLGLVEDSLPSIGSAVSPPTPTPGGCKFLVWSNEKYEIADVAFNTS